MLGFLQFGVAVPGRVEPLIHAKRTVEEVALRDGLGAVAVVDMDLIIASGCSSGLKRWTLWESTCLNWSCG